MAHARNLSLVLYMHVIHGRRHDATPEAIDLGGERDVYAVVVQCGAIQRSFSGWVTGLEDAVADTLLAVTDSGASISLISETRFRDLVSSGTFEPVVSESASTFGLGATMT